MNVKLYGGTNGGRVIAWPRGFEIYNFPKIEPRPVRAPRTAHPLTAKIYVETYRLTPFGYRAGDTGRQYRAFAGVLIGYELTDEDEEEIFRNLQPFDWTGFGL